MWGDAVTRQREERMGDSVATSSYKLIEAISLKPLNMTMCSWWNQVTESIEGANRNEIGACIMKDSQPLQQLSLVKACWEEEHSENCKLSPSRNIPLREKVSVSPSPAY